MEPLLLFCSTVFAVPYGRGEKPEPGAEQTKPMLGTLKSCTASPPPNTRDVLGPECPEAKGKKQCIAVPN